MKNLLYGTLALLALALAVCAACLTFKVMELCDQTAATEHAFTETAAFLPSQVDRIKADVLLLVDQHARKIENTLDGAVAKTDAHLHTVERIASGQLSAANLSIATVSNAAAAELPVLGVDLNNNIARIEADVHQVTSPAASVLAQVNDAAPLYLDCEFNPDCAFNRFQGVSKATEQTMQAVAKSAPEMAQSAAKIEGHMDAIAADVQREADAITKPKRWWQKALSVVEVGSITAARILF